jgi:hypothetical protein
MVEATGEDEVHQSRAQIYRLRTNRWSDQRSEGTRTKLSTRRTQRHPQIPTMMFGSKGEHRGTPKTPKLGG